MADDKPKDDKKFKKVEIPPPTKVSPLPESVIKTLGQKPKIPPATKVPPLPGDIIKKQQKEPESPLPTQTEQPTQTRPSPPPSPPSASTPSQNLSFDQRMATGLDRLNKSLDETQRKLRSTRFTFPKRQPYNPLVLLDRTAEILGTTATTSAWVPVKVAEVLTRNLRDRLRSQPEAGGGTTLTKPKSETETASTSVLPPQPPPPPPTSPPPTPPTPPPPETPPEEPPSGEKPHDTKPPAPQPAPSNLTEREELESLTAKAFSGVALTPQETGRLAELSGSLKIPPSSSAFSIPPDEGERKPKPQGSRWPYYVAPPAWGAWAITDPTAAFAAIPQAAVGVPAFIGYTKLKRKVEELKARLGPLRWITQPGQTVREKLQRELSTASQRLVRSGVHFTAGTLGRGWLFKVHKHGGYKTLEFMPSYLARRGLSNFLEKRAKGLENSRWSKAAKQLKAFRFEYDRRGRPQRKRKLRGVGILFGLLASLIVGPVVGYILDQIKDRVKPVAKLVKFLQTRGAGAGRSWRVAKGAASWNTLGGAALGYAIGGPFGALIGGSGGAFYTMARNASEINHWKYRYRLAELEKTGELKNIKLPAEMKPFGKWQSRLYRPAALMGKYQLLRYAPFQGTALGFIFGGPAGAVYGSTAQFAWMARPWLFRKIGGGLDYATQSFSPRLANGNVKYARFDAFLKTGPRWARWPGWGLEQLRLPRRYAGGVGAGALVGFSISGGSPFGALAGAAVGGGAQIGAAAGIRGTTRGISTLFRRYPRLRYSKGGAAGSVLIGLPLTGLGVPFPIALGAGAAGGAAVQFTAKAVLKRMFVGGSTSRTEAAAASKLGLARIGAVKFAGKFIPIVGWMDLGRSAFKEALRQVEYELKTGQPAMPTLGKRSKLQLKAEYYFLKVSIAVLDVALIPWDWFWDKGINYLYDAGAFAFGWTRSLPGVGGIFDAVGDFLGGIFGGAKDAIKAAVGFAQGMANIAMAFFAAVGTLVFGGDIVEASIALALALVFAGSVFGTGGLCADGDIPDELCNLLGDITGLVEKPPGPGESQYVDLTKRVTLEPPAQPPVTSLKIDCPLKGDGTTDCGQVLGKKVRFYINIDPKNVPLQNLVCADRAAVIGRYQDPAVEVLNKTHADLGCPSSLGATENKQVEFTFDIPNDQKFYDAVITNTFALSGETVGPNNDTCGGRYALNNPLGNFGDPLCDWSITKLSETLRRLDPAHHDKWMCIQSTEGGPNSYNPNSPDPKGAWGEFQMDRGSNGIYDHGDVIWQQQISNAIDYNHYVLAPLGLDFQYWQAARPGGSCVGVNT